MNEVTAEQFAESVRAAIGTVTHFYGQIDRVNAALKEALTTDPERFSFLGEIPSKPATRRPFRVIRYDYGGLYGVDAADGEDDFEEDGADPGADDEGESPQKVSRPLELLPDQPVLAIRMLLYDSKRPEEWEPRILYAVMTDWRYGSKLTKPKPLEPFRIHRYMVPRIVRTVDPRMQATPVGQRLITKAKVIGRGRSGSRDSDASLSAILFAPVQSARLYDLDGSGAVENLVTKIKAYWREHLAVESAD